MDNAQNVRKTQQLKYNAGQLLLIYKKIGGLHLFTMCLTEAIIAEGIAGEYFAANITLHELLTALYWWPIEK